MQKTMRPSSEDPRGPGGAPEGERNGTAASFLAALLIGLPGVALICFFTYWYETFIHRAMPQVVIFSLTPIAFFLIFVVAGGVNPLLHRLHPSLALRRRELVVVLSVWLFTGAVCFRDVVVPQLFTIANVYNTRIHSPIIKRLNIVARLRPDLFLPGAAAMECYYGLSPDGMSRVSPWPLSSRLAASDVKDPALLAAKLGSGADAMSAFLRGRMTPGDRAMLAPGGRPEGANRSDVARVLNRLVAGPCFVNDPALPAVKLDDTPRRLINRLLLERAFPEELPPSAVPVPWSFEAAFVRRPERLAQKLRLGADGPSRHVGAGTKALAEAAAGVPATPSPAEEAKLRDALVKDLNALLEGPPLYETPAFRALRVEGAAAERVNRLLLEQSYGGEISPVPPHVPWGLWAGPLTFWAPLMVVVAVLSFSLVRTMQHQWSRNELLAYPIAEVADQLLARSEGRPFPAVFYDKIFWSGFLITAFVYVVNGLHNWFPLMVEIPLEFEYRDLLRQFPFLSRYCGSEAYSLFRGWGWPFMIAIAVLLPTEVSLTWWLGYVLMIFGAGFYFLATGEAMTYSDQSSLQTGMYIAMFAVVLYLGREEYAKILRLALSPRIPKTHRLRVGAVACRVYLVSCAALAALFVYAGINLFMSLFLVGTFSMIVVLLARVTAEAGFPWLSSFSMAARNIPMKLIGSAAIGPQALAVMAVVAAVLHSDASNTVAAQTTTHSKLLEDPKDSRDGWPVSLILFLGLLAAIGFTTFFTLWDHYSFGAQVDAGSSGYLRRNLESASNDINALRLEGVADRLDSMSALGRLAHIRVDLRFVRFFAYGLLVVGGCAFLRQRFAWWPLHPLPLLLVNTWTLSRLYQSCLIGWFVKVLILRIGGGRVYTRSKPFFVGVIFGQIVTCGVWIAIEGVYYALTGARPTHYRYFS